MFNKSPQRNFEWFESTFSKKIQTIIDENKRDNLSWIRDLFVSLLITIFSLCCQLINTDNSPVLEIVLKCSTIVSLVGLLGWFLFCVIKYNKKLKKLKHRIVPHKINFYSIDESVELFDNDICNGMILSKSYISLAEATPDASLKKFYFIEAIHYYFKSIREFNNICSSTSEKFDALFANTSGVDRKINILRLTNYLELIKSVEINRTNLDEPLIKDITYYFDSYSTVVQTFSTILPLLTKKYSELKDFSTEIIKLGI